MIRSQPRTLNTQEKGHFKIYIHLFVWIENQCYCQVVIQTYPFASIQFFDHKSSYGAPFRLQKFVGCAFFT